MQILFFKQYIFHHNAYFICFIIQFYIRIWLKVIEKRKSKNTSFYPTIWWPILVLKKLKNTLCVQKLLSQPCQEKGVFFFQSRIVALEIPVYTYPEKSSWKLKLSRRNENCIQYNLMTSNIYATLPCTVLRFTQWKGLPKLFWHYVLHIVIWNWDLLTSHDSHNGNECYDKLNVIYKIKLDRLVWIIV